MSTAPAPTEHEPLRLRPQATSSSRILLTVEAAAKQLSIGRTTMYGLIKAGHIATVRVGHLRRVPMTAITAYVDQLASGASSAAA